MAKKITATFIKKQTSATGAQQEVYKLSSPVGYNYSYKEDKYTQETDHIVVSGVHAMFSGPETYIFPSDKDGEVLDHGELDGSFQGAIDHKRALEDAGYTIKN